MNTGCEFYADALVDRATGHLEAGRRQRLDEHLAECAECAASLRTLIALRAAPLEVPADLEPSIRAAVRQARRPAAAPATVVRSLGHAPWRAWALPIAAAAALAGIWLGVGTPGSAPGDAEDPVFFAFDDREPYGVWPADGLIVAGDPMLSELSLEELETLLQELES